MTIEEFRTGATPRIEQFNGFVQRKNLVGRAAPDHLCYKCGSKESFEAMRAMFEQESVYTHQTIISGRRIAYIKLKDPLQTVLGDMLFVELSDQKPDNSQTDSYDHIEVYATAMSYANMVGELAQREHIMHVERPHHTTDDIDMGGGFLFRCTQGPLIEKIKAVEL